MTIDPDAFRAVLGRFASGITIVTAIDAQGRDVGMTVSAFSAASLHPPLIQVCVNREASMFETLRQHAKGFGVSILSSDQEALSRRFAEEDSVHRFDGLGYVRGDSGVVLLDDALAHIECRMHASYDAGDHMIFVGEVEHATTGDARPLLYYRGGYAQLER
jgi:flavin reductase (DIM6/NTAB) family NADH-FMN oxidoreductase RutF